VRRCGVLCQGTLIAASAQIWKRIQAFPKRKISINADDALKAVFGGKKQVSMFEMPTKLVSKHVK
jgi:chromatin remodeling complex protein RSC6